MKFQRKRKENCNTQLLKTSYWLL